MSIPVTCPDCQSHFHVGDEYAGRPGRCPECTAILQVPDPAVPDDPAPHVDPYPYASRRELEAFEPGPLPPPMPRRTERSARDEDWEENLRADYDDRPRRSVPRERAERWARVHRGLGYLQVAVVLGFVSQILQTLLMLARGGVPDNPNGLMDSGQIALGFGGLLMILAAWMFWVMGRAAGLRVPYVPARPPARASFIMVVCSIGGCVLSICFLFGLVGAAQQGGKGGEVVLMGVMAFGTMLVTAGLTAGAEVTGLMSLGRIGEGLRDRAAAGWARRSIVVLFLTGGLMMFGLCGVFAYVVAKGPPRQQAQDGADPGPGAKKEAGGDKGKAAVRDKADQPKDVAPPPAANGGGQGPPEPVDETLALITNLVLYVPLLVYLIHYSMALQAGRRAIRHEIDVLTGRDHGEHDRPY